MVCAEGDGSNYLKKSWLSTLKLQLDLEMLTSYTRQLKRTNLVLGSKFILLEKIQLDVCGI